MKTRTLIFSLVSILLLALTTCKKDPQPIMERFDLSREDLTVGTTSASIVGTYVYSGAIDEITVCVSEDGVHPATFLADINGKNFTVEMTSLRPATSYQYYYSVDYGFTKPFITEAKSFTTLSESPTVRTIDVISIDSTTVRVNCETVSDGGMEITERGVCWNTYGNPNLDDESLTYTSAGLGQYSCRINGLALGKKYYVKAYAKNASGIGFGEELEFETAAPPGMPVNIELSCDPEEGGSVSGGGIYTVGSQCTVTAVASSGYTFVNWTENGNQVSTEATYTFNVTRECHLVANFTTQAYIITAEVTPDNSGTVTGAGGYNYGEECTLTATAKPGYEFVKWTKNGTNVSTDATFTFTVNASATYLAHFQTKSYTVSVSAQPSNGGTVSGGGTFNYGQSCTVHATPAEGYTFINWTYDGDVVSTDVDYTFVVNGDRILVANFSTNMQTYTISVSANPTNGGTVTGGGVYQEGQGCLLGAVANNDYIFVSWKENGVEVSTSSSYYFVVACNRVLEANFVLANDLIDDFEENNWSFETDYERDINVGGSGNEGHYYLGNNAHNYGDELFDFPDHTTGNGQKKYMIVNGHTQSNKLVWGRTLDVSPHSYYAFTLWVTNLSSGGGTYNSMRSKLRVKINGDVMTFPDPYEMQNVSSTHGIWNQMPVMVWYSGNNSTAHIEIYDTNQTDNGNDFGLDDISFTYQYTNMVNAVDDAVSTHYGTPVDFFPKQNDIIIPSSISSMVNLSIVEQPSHGSLILNGECVRYTPDNGFMGIDGFTYMLTFGTNDIVSYGRVEVTVTN